MIAALRVSEGLECEGDCTTLWGLERELGSGRGLDKWVGGEELYTAEVAPFAPYHVPLFL